MSSRPIDCPKRVGGLLHREPRATPCGDLYQPCSSDALLLLLAQYPAPFSPSPPLRSLRPRVLIRNLLRRGESRGTANSAVRKVVCKQPSLDRVTTPTALWTPANRGATHDGGRQRRHHNLLRKRSASPESILSHSPAPPVIRRPVLAVVPFLYPRCPHGKPVLDRLLHERPHLHTSPCAPSSSTSCCAATGEIFVAHTPFDESGHTVSRPSPLPVPPSSPGASVLERDRQVDRSTAATIRTKGAPRRSLFSPIRSYNLRLAQIRGGYWLQRKTQSSLPVVCDAKEKNANPKRGRRVDAATR